MGVEGAGIATFLSQAFASWLCWIFIKKNMTELVPKGDERAFDNKKISILLNNGVPMGLQFYNGRFISNSSFLLAFTTTKNENCYGNRSE